MKNATAFVLLLFTSLSFAENYGAPLTLKNAISVEAAIAAASQQSSPILVEGKIGSVCQAKGCWMGFNSDAGDVRVTFKDYGFFVPITVVGKTVQAEGTLQKVTLSLEDSKHLVEDGGGDPDSVTEPMIEYQMVASGVVIK
jgi:hypothetical protein